MGGKHFKPWQHVLLCTAGIILLFISGCATFGEIYSRHKAQQNINHGKELLAKGDFNGSLEENMKVLSVFLEGPPGDEALFNIGLIYAHYGNPAMNYKESLLHFRTLTKKYPQSPFIVQSRILIKLLDSILKEKSEDKAKKEELKAVNNEPPKTDVHLIQSRQFLSKGDYEAAIKANLEVLGMPPKSPFKDKALFNIALIYAHYNNPEKDYKKSIKYFMELIEKFPQSSLIEQTKIWLDVLNVIEKAKQVDIDIEKKKEEMKK